MITATKTLHLNALFAANKAEPKKPSALKRFGLRLVAMWKGCKNGYNKAYKAQWTLLSGQEKGKDLINNFKSSPGINSLKLARKGAAFVPQIYVGTYVVGPAGAIYGACKTAATGKVYGAGMNTGMKS
ncbi:hypothetical protein ACWJJH_03290 [Endozoicomonadaceae bacterium StTr2]